MLNDPTEQPQFVNRKDNKAEVLPRPPTDTPGG